MVAIVRVVVEVATVALKVLTTVAVLTAVRALVTVTVVVTGGTGYFEEQYA